ncbi:SMK killer toxin resistance protein [Fusarium torreyae]|uniref:SMK killer toxin resistance protein n=1 Tax=Fusarium torreyae TaxID=1237075 RepID=A0A9W8VQM9_9HYPO|nr:SMK killer toxin resistance protein [Fusarium torreyae]
MSSFIVKLWEDIFTPGPTPTILKAANASFAALQTVLFLLLLATYNIHCVILSILCAGLWWSVNWFAAELAIAQREQREKEQREKQQQQQKEASGNDDDSGTEVETSAPNKAPPVASVAATTSDVAAAAGLEPVETKGEVKQRAVAAAGTQSSVSTEDEWEKVSEAENEKDK